LALLNLESRQSLVGAAQSQREMESVGLTVAVREGHRLEVDMLKALHSTVFRRIFVEARQA